MAAMASYLYLSRSKQHDDWQCDTLKRGECQILPDSHGFSRHDLPYSGSFLVTSPFLFNEKGTDRFTDVTEVPHGSALFM